MRRKKLWKILSNVLLAILIAAVIIFVAPRLFGIQVYSVLSGSMEPAYHTGDLIYTVPTDVETIKEGDVISFLMNDDGKVATHRVVEVDRENQNFYTKGDANNTGDGKPVHFNNVIGVVRFRIPMLGYAVGYMNTQPGKIITGTIIAALVILVLLLQVAGKTDEEEEKKSKKYKKERKKWLREEPEAQEQSARHSYQELEEELRRMNREEAERETLLQRIREEQKAKERLYQAKLDRLKREQSMEQERIEQVSSSEPYTARRKLEEDRYRGYQYETEHSLEATESGIGRMSTRRPEQYPAMDPYIPAVAVASADGTEILSYRKRFALQGKSWNEVMTHGETRMGRRRMMGK